VVVSDFEFAVRLMSGVGPVVKAAVGQRTAEALVEEEEQECDLNTLGREPVSVTATVSFD